MNKVYNEKGGKEQIMTEKKVVDIINCVRPNYLDKKILMLLYYLMMEQEKLCIPTVP